MTVERRGPGSWEDAAGGVALALGVFDGVHVGHRHVLATLRRRADGLGVPPGVLTFDPHPLEVVAPEHAPPLLTTLEHRIELFAEAGVALTAVLAFDEAVRDVAPTAFVGETLAGDLRARLVVVGEDFRFGRDRTGHVGLLAELGEGHGFEVEVVPLVGGDRPWSSTRIRQMVAAGDVGAARAALGRPHEVWGKVVEGDRRGSTIGFPTANLDTHPRAALPANGVYAVTVGHHAAEALAGVANVGLRPTFGGDERPVVEAHVLDGEHDLYGDEIRVRFIDRIRDERRFDGVDALTEQIEKDVHTARRLLQGD
jgi:riboflavin kinase/FMN adenylyltransferase